MVYISFISRVCNKLFPIAILKIFTHEPNFARCGIGFGVTEGLGMGSTGVEGGVVHLAHGALTKRLGLD